MPAADSQRPSVVVVGGGYAGIHAAKELDALADVTLVEPKDAFHHNVAALRALVDPGWLPRTLLPYDGLLAHGRVVRDRAIAVEDGRVTLGSGEVLEPDYVVLATGSRYPFPAKTEAFDRDETVTRVRVAHAALADATSVLLVGAGPVGIELAGEITAVWPDKQVHLLDVADDLLTGPFRDDVRAELRRQLDARGVVLHLGSPLVDAPPTQPGEPGAFTVTTEAGTSIEADLWFRCYGVAPVTDYLTGSLAGARRPDGYLDVTPYLQVVGHPTVFAVGDISAADRDTAGVAGRQATLAAANVAALIEDRDLTAWEPMPPVILLPLGPTGGTGQLPGADEPATAEQVSAIKGADMMVDRFAELLGAPLAELLADELADELAT